MFSHNSMFHSQLLNKRLQNERVNMTYGNKIMKFKNGENKYKHYSWEKKFEEKERVKDKSKYDDIDTKKKNKR